MLSWRYIAMPHISSKRLKEEEEKLLKSRLVKVFRIIGKDRNVSYSLAEILTHTEMIMLAKRLGIIFFVYKEMSTLDISEALKVSTSTVQIIEKKFDRGGYQSLRRLFRKLEPSLQEMLEIMLRGQFSKD